MRKVILAGACRTAIGSMGGSLCQTPAQELGAAVIKEALARANVPADAVDEVYMGCVLQAGLGQNPARQAAVKAGLPYEVPATTINVVCASGLQSINLAAAMVAAGIVDVAVAGGMENMSQAPYLLQQGRFGYRLGDGKLVDTMVHDALWDSFHQYHMGVTAENIAARWSLTREELDAFAVRSQHKAQAAIEKQVFSDEIVPVTVKEKKSSRLFLTDENPRKGVTAEGLARLKPAFQAGGVVTAGNASSINDGAAAVVVMSENAAKQYGTEVMAYWKAGALAGVDPAIMGIGPVASTKKVLNAAGAAITDLDLIEANEAFAAQSIAVAKELGIPEEKLNVNGGAIALGHPVGASGCRILVSLLHEMRRSNKQRGLATLCVGGGMGCSTLVER